MAEWLAFGLPALKNVFFFFFETDLLGGVTTNSGVHGLQ